MRRVRCGSGQAFEGLAQRGPDALSEALEAARAELDAGKGGEISTGFFIGGLGGGSSGDFSEAGSALAHETEGGIQRAASAGAGRLGGIIVITPLEQDGPQEAVHKDGARRVDFFSWLWRVARHGEGGVVKEGAKQRGAVGEKGGAQAFLQPLGIAGTVPAQPPAGDLEEGFRFGEPGFAGCVPEFFFEGSSGPLRSVRVSVRAANSSVRDLSR